MAQTHKGNLTLEANYSTYAFISETITWLQVFLTLLQNGYNTLKMAASLYETDFLFENNSLLITVL